MISKQKYYAWLVDQVHVTQYVNLCLQLFGEKNENKMPKIPNIETKEEELKTELNAKRVIKSQSFST